ncbi:MAG TPA: thioredoxin-disulfide reductase [Thermoanaerobaculia bacterium]|nr:thioredoxin-disulfide reductase [Thermoanaerobaculia bacterium]
MSTAPTEHSNEHRLIILGSGPAGLTAALYAARADLAPLVLEGNQPGGQLTITTEVENYPGFPEGILGPELMDKMREQARRFGATVKFEAALEVDLSERPFTIKTDEATYTAQALIVATGASAKLGGLEADDELMGYGISACATCDGFFFRDKEVIVVGGGDSAMEEANFLTKYAAKVTVVHRRRELRASKIMQERAFQNPKIAWLWNSELTHVLGTRESGVTGIRVRDVETGVEREHPAQGLFYAIGHVPNTQLFQGQLDMNVNGYLIVQEPTTLTNVPGVFAAGDIHDPSYRQAVTSAGSGCKAAIDAERFLSEHGPEHHD